MSDPAGSVSVPPVTSPGRSRPPGFLSRRPTNWWIVGGLVAAGLVGAVAIKASRSGGGASQPPGPNDNDYAELREAVAMLRAQGRLPQAERAARRGVELAAVVHGDEHFAMGDALNTLALVLSDQAKYGEAISAYRMSIPIIQGVFGPASLEVGQTLGNLALTLTKAADYAAARPLFERALAIAEAATGPESLETALAVNNLAYLNDTAGDHAAARPLHERAYAVRRKALGVAHLQTIESMANLAANLIQPAEKGRENAPKTGGATTAGQRAGETPSDRRRAVKLYRQAIAVRSRLLPGDSLELANVLNGAATIAREQGEIDEADRMAFESLAIRQAKLGIDHPTTAASFDSLARIREVQKEFDEAREFFNAALAIRLRRLGPAHPKTRDSLEALAMFELARGDKEAAEKVLRQTIGILETDAGGHRSGRSPGATRRHSQGHRPGQGGRPTRGPSYEGPRGRGRPRPNPSRRPTRWSRPHNVQAKPRR